MSKQRWQEIQEQEYNAGQEKFNQTGSYFGFFSVPEFHVTNDIARRLAEIDGPILDIGCGLLSMPNYLKDCKQPYGIDPYLGQARQFPFAQAIGEALPFPDKTFEAALLMSSLDHAIEPERMIAEAARVLVNGGLLFIWYTPRIKPDKHHEWAMSRDGVKAVAGDYFSEEKLIAYGRDMVIGFPRTEMIIMRKARYD